MIKALALDIDNTLLNPQGELSAATLAAVREALEAGLQVVLATARGYRSTAPIHRQLGLTTPAVCHAGALVYDFARAQPLATWPLPRELAISLARLAEQLQLTVSAYVGAEVWFNRPPDAPLRPDWSICSDLPAALARVPEILEMVVVGTAEGRRFQQALLEQDWAGQLSLTAVREPEHDVLFIGRTGIDKATALDWLWSRLGLDWSQVAACGDSSSDLQMVQRAGWGVAPPAASQLIRSAAHPPLQLDCAEPIASLVRQILRQQA